MLRNKSLISTQILIETLLAFLYVGPEKSLGSNLAFMGLVWTWDLRKWTGSLRLWYPIIHWPWWIEQCHGCLIPMPGGCESGWIRFSWTCARLSGFELWGSAISRTMPSLVLDGIALPQTDQSSWTHDSCLKSIWQSWLGGTLDSFLLCSTCIGFLIRGCWSWLLMA